ncbi:MAG: hypothetical protein WBD34_04750 [Burkholderiaceae bacterium]
MTDSKPHPGERIVGLIPAAGRATRLAGLTCSKEVLAVGPGPSPRPVSAWLIDQMAHAGAAQVYFILREGKWDIPATFGHGRHLGINIAYVLMDEPWGPPFTINQALPFVDDAIVMIGFPDILLWPRNAFGLALDKLKRSDALAVLGSFNAIKSDGCDLIRTDPDGRVTEVHPKETNPSWEGNNKTWLFAVWRPAFTAFFQERVRVLGEQARHSVADTPPEWPVGTIVADAIEAGLAIDSVHFERGRFLDIGEPQRLSRADSFPLFR